MTGAEIILGSDRLVGPRLTFPTGRRFAPPQGQPRPLLLATGAVLL